MKNDKRMTKYKMAAGCLKNCIGPISTKKEKYIYEEVITTTLKIISATTKVILTTEKVTTDNLKVISVTTKMILTTWLRSLLW